MNLFLLASTGDPSIRTGPGLGFASRVLDGEPWAGLKLEPAPDAQLRIPGATAYHPFRERPDSVGWRAMAPKGRGVLRVQIRGDDGGVAERELRLDGRPVDVLLPWRLDDRARTHELSLHAPQASRGPVFVGVFRKLDRSEAVALCAGRGVEIGPGPRPHVLPGPGVQVRYLEPLLGGDWWEAYGKMQAGDFDPALAGLYDAGEAHQIPAEDGGLDFIFSSHVFEHLANPLGHLQLWKRKLKPGGRVVAVVPELSGAGDYRAWPSTLAEWLEEFEAGGMQPGPAHFRRHAAARGNPHEADRHWKRRQPIHAHFYTRTNVTALLEEATRRFGYSAYALRHTPNHKDFYFCLTA